MKDKCIFAHANSLHPSKAKFPLTSTAAELCFGDIDRMREILHPLSYLKDYIVPAGVLDTVDLMYLLVQQLWVHDAVPQPTLNKIPVIVNNKEPKKPWGQQLCFPCPECHFRDLRIPSELKKLKQKS